MTQHTCNHEKDFARLDIVYKEVMGNGKEGLAKSSIRLQEAVNNLIPVVNAIKTSMSAFHEFRIETEATIRENERHKLNKKWYITSMIALGVFAVAFAGLFILS